MIADGELVQERRGRTLRVRARWVFADGMVAEERAEFEAGRALVQTRYSWVETRDGEVHRRFEVDFETGEASSLVTKDGKPERERAKLELPRGRTFAGYGTALAAAELPLERGGKDELHVRGVHARAEGGRTRGAARGAGGGLRRRAVHPVRALHAPPEDPAIARPFVKAEDAHLWFTQTSPRALLRAEQNLAAKDDPRVVIDVIPRGPRGGERAAWASRRARGQAAPPAGAAGLRPARTGLVGRGPAAAGTPGRGSARARSWPRLGVRRSETRKPWRAPRFRSEQMDAAHPRRRPSGGGSAPNSAQWRRSHRRSLLGHAPAATGPPASGVARAARAGSRGLRARAGRARRDGAAARST